MTAVALRRNKPRAIVGRKEPHNLARTQNSHVSSSSFSGLGSNEGETDEQVIVGRRRDQYESPHSRCLLLVVTALSACEPSGKSLGTVLSCW